jgi:archaellin
VNVNYMRKLIAFAMVAALAATFVLGMVGCAQQQPAEQAPAETPMEDHSMADTSMASDSMAADTTHSH